MIPDIRKCSDLKFLVLIICEWKTNSWCDINTSFTKVLFLVGGGRGLYKSTDSMASLHVQWHKLFGNSVTTNTDITIQVNKYSHMGDTKFKQWLRLDILSEGFHVPPYKCMNGSSKHVITAFQILSYSYPTTPHQCYTVHLLWSKGSATLNTMTAVLFHIYMTNDQYLNHTVLGETKCQTQTSE
jgi:hypothetical protein